MGNKKQYRSVGVNAVLNTIKSGIAILFPLLTYPYAFRVLHASGMGKVDYSNSIVGYFSLIAALGISSYAVREGSKVREDRKELEKIASQIFSINFISTVISYILLVICVFFIPQLKPYSMLILLLSLTTGFSTLGVEWINTIYEDYLYITIRSILTHVVTLVLLFILVRNEDDYYYYALLTVITNAIICVMNWYRCKEYLTIRLTFDLGLDKHLRPILLLFANGIATTIYVGADTTMLGIIAGDFYVGLYSIAVKIYSVMKRLLVAMYSVTIPRIAYYWGQNDINGVRRIYSKMLSNLIVILLPASFGLICVAKEVIFFMGGSEYSESVLTLQILSVALVGAILGGAVTYCLNIPIGLEKYNLIATIISAVINIVLNIIILPVWKQNGAAFSTAVSEFWVFFFCVFTNKRFKEFIDVKMIGRNFIQAVIGCMGIFIITFLVHGIVKDEALSLIIIMCVSCSFYIVELLVLKNELATNVITRAKKRIIK